MNSPAVVPLSHTAKVKHIQYTECHRAEKYRDNYQNGEWDGPSNRLGLSWNRLRVPTHRSMSEAQGRAKRLWQLPCNPKDSVPPVCSQHALAANSSPKYNLTILLAAASNRNSTRTHAVFMR